MQSEHFSKIKRTNHVISFSLHLSTLLSFISLTPKVLPDQSPALSLGIEMGKGIKN